MRNYVSSILVIVALVSIAISTIISCGGGSFATSNMTLTVNPTSKSLTYSNTTVNATGIQDFHVSVLKQDGTAASGITVFVRMDSAFSGVLSFEGCGTATKCSCTTGSAGYCIIRAIYKYGTTYGEWRETLLFYSGPLTKTVTIETKAE